MENVNGIKLSNILKIMNTVMTKMQKSKQRQMAKKRFIFQETSWKNPDYILDWWKGTKDIVISETNPIEPLILPPSNRSHKPEHSCGLVEPS